MTAEREPPARRSGYRYTVHLANGIHRPVISIVFDLDSSTPRSVRTPRLVVCGARRR